MCAMPLEREIEYPESDGQPMAETTLHRIVMNDVIGGLERRHAGDEDVWVGGNLFVYWEEGNPKKSVSPDVLLVRGVSKWPRRTFCLWEEKIPALIFEITSRKTRREDTRDKKSLYEQLGVSELVLFDPYGEYLRPRLQGYRLEEARYLPIPLHTDGSLSLRTEGLTVRPEGERLRLSDAATGEKLLWADEIDAALRAAEERAAGEATARRAAEERVQALAGELARLRGEKLPG